MSTALYHLGRTMFRRWPAVALCWLLGLLVCGCAALVLSRGTTSDFRIPGTESQDSLDTLTSTFPEASGACAQVLVEAGKGRIVEDEEVRTAVLALVARLEKVEQVSSVGTPDGSTRSADGRAQIVSVLMDGEVDDVRPATRRQLRAVVAAAGGPAATFTIGGDAFPVEEPGLSPTEGIGLVVALVVLLLAFGSPLAAGIPLVTAIAGTAVTMLCLLALTAFTAVSASAPLLAVMIGLAVGIDYALFVLDRHRALLAEGLPPGEAAARAVGTAGAAVVFAGATVMVALAGLAVVGIPFLTVMGACAAFGVLAAVVSSLTLLPAAMGMLGERLVPRPGRRRDRRWGGGIALRHPLATTFLVTIGLGAALVPAAGLHLVLPDAGASREGSPTRSAYDRIAERMGPGWNGPLLVTGSVVTSDDPVATVEGIARRLRQVDGVAAVPFATPDPNGTTMVVEVVPRDAPTSTGTADLVRRLRDLRPRIAAEFGTRIGVTGPTAVGIDVSGRLKDALVPFGVLVVGLSLVLLAVLFRSLWIPLTAAAGFCLSVGAALGAVVAVFQWGWLKGPLGVVSTGPVISFMPIIVLGVLFGLAMDYEVFLVSRMREEFVRTGDARGAVPHGLSSASRVVGAAAVIMVSVFVAFVPAGDAVIQPIALGLAVGVFVDAFLVRMTLVPAVLTLLDRRAWGLPAALERSLPHLDVEGEGIRRRIGLEQWPTPAAPHGVYIQDLVLEDGSGPLVRVPNLALAPGNLLFVVGGTATGRTGLAFLVSGRTAPSSGRLKVCGSVLPQDGRTVRRSTLLVRAREQDGVPARLHGGVGRGTRLVVVDGLEHVVSLHERGAVLAECERLCSDQGMTCVITSLPEALLGLPAPDPSTTFCLDLGHEGGTGHDDGHDDGKDAR